MNYIITQSRLLYVLSINDRKHRDLLKVGEVFVNNDIADNPDTQVREKAVRDVLNSRSYMNGVTYNLEYVECTTFAQQIKCYKADDVHRTLMKNGIIRESKAKVDKEEADFWFHCTLADIQNAISQIKEGNGAGYGEIKFRPEQEKAISSTVDYFTKEYKDKNKGKSFLWNAKMRFGKTLSGLEVAKRCDYKSTLIITHRPVVDKGWGEDFDKIFKYPSSQGTPNYYYATRMDVDVNHNDRKPNHIQNITLSQFNNYCKDVDNGNKRLVMFVSMQYLRLSQFVGGKEKNFDPLKKAIMLYDWDFVMVDEAHEGIEAAAGVRVMDKLKKENTRILSLSGTPFNLLDKYDEDEIYTWDYVMEQRAKQEWDDKHFGDPNPYAELPRMQILTFTLPKMVRDEAIKDNEVFKFHEFFRVWTEEDKNIYQNLIDNEKSPQKREVLKAQQAEIKVDKFIHEGAVRRFLDKLVEESETSQYPFSTDEFREHFRHTFWLLPGVKEAAALYELLEQHNVFGKKNDMFHIINAAGDGNIEDKDGSALADVVDNIRGNAAKNITKKDYTITLSCGKLTTGVSVPEWTAVLCMKGSENTPAANYMQTIFRVQTHAVLNGRQKSDCYVFDFAPDRALIAVAETAKMAVDAQGAGRKQMKRKQKEEEEHLGAFIELCPVVSMDEGEMGRNITANEIFEKLSNVYIERAVRSGYADNSLYNPDQLLNLTPEQEKALGDVRDLLGSMPNIWKPDKIHINNNGLENIDDVDQIKSVYYLSDTDSIPTRPLKSPNLDENGCPKTDDPIWSDIMNLPDELFPYLYVSHSTLKDGQWSEFSDPVLWTQFKPVDPNAERARAQREKENKEKRARMSVLRGVSIRIPLLVYGAEINDEDGEEITIDNFASNGENGEKVIVDDASWEEFMPKGFTKKTFNILKDCFDRSIFTGAAKRIRQLVKEADNLNTEDRIAKIATIFSYFHNPDKETVLTPWRVVNMQLSDCLGGWCFYNEQFDAENTIENQYGENIKMPRPVGIQVNDKNEITGFTNDVTKDVFSDYNARILEINSKTGLYPLYMAYSLFKTSKEKAFREKELTGERGTSKDSEDYYRQAGNDLEIWKDVLQDNIFVVCRTKMAVSITKRTLAGFRNDIRMNVKCYSKDVEVNDLVSAGVLKRDAEGMTKRGNTFYFNGKSKLDCDMITVLRANPEAFRKDIVQGIDFWHVYNSIPKKANENINNMEFKAIVGNPPYQIMDGGTQMGALPVYQHFVYVSKRICPNYLSMIMPSRWFAGGRGLDDFRTDMLNDDRLSTLVDFPKARDCFDNVDIAGGLCYFLWDKKHHADCHIISSIRGARTESQRKLNEFDIFIRDNIGMDIINRVRALKETTVEHRVLKVSPFGIRSFVRGEEFNVDDMISLKSSAGIGYINRDVVTKNFDLVGKYKLMCGYLNPDRAGVNNASDGKSSVTTKLTILKPDEVVTETYIIIGTFDTEQEVQNYASFMKTKFVRFLVLQTMTSMHITQANYRFVPDLDYTKTWTDKELYERYKLNKSEIDYIESLIREME